MKSAVIVAAALTLGGCASSGVITGIKPVCDAMIGPITYSTRPQTDAAKRRYAGPDLAPQLAERNRVGVNLGCPQYRHVAAAPPMPVKAPPVSFTTRFHAVWPVWR